MSEGAKLIRIVAAVIRDGDGRSLLVRKRGAQVFQQPGGKRDRGDADDLATLARELREELGCELLAASARLLCHCSAPAANEPDHVVEAAVYVVQVRGAVAPQAEIEELRWVDPAEPGELPIARLSREHIMPLLRG
ncbi:NUDIX hydrolase [Frateuria sp. Soil773]|uniref:NUDIX hydrolase n=1 Tax=Frateuria sp. Soil773 TaxID=1736407 RepID=UPI0006FA58F5|nr:NUDIX domain-containing protein [Frateuria sp. Soil773]KRE91335.1 NUDIX hydrolase [Frateuria sp. Soil773]